MTDLSRRRHEDMVKRFACVGGSLWMKRRLSRRCPGPRTRLRRRLTVKPRCSRRSPKCRNRIAFLGERLHAIIKANAPALSPKLWYGMPAYARDGKIVCFFQSAEKFKTRYATFGFMHEANLDEGDLWPTAYALKKLNAAEEARIGALVKKAAS